jgi:hypothetical protein
MRHMSTIYQYLERDFPAHVLFVLLAQAPAPLGAWNPRQYCPCHVLHLPVCCMPGYDFAQHWLLANHPNRNQYSLFLSLHPCECLACHWILVLVAAMSVLRVGYVYSDVETSDITSEMRAEHMPQHVAYTESGKYLSFLMTNGVDKHFRCRRRIFPTMSMGNRYNRPCVVA